MSLSIIGLLYEVCWQWHLFMMLQLVKPYPDSELHFIDMFQNMKRGSATWRLRDQTSKLRILSPPIMLTIKHERNWRQLHFTLPIKGIFCKNSNHFLFLKTYFVQWKCFSKSVIRVASKSNKRLSNLSWNYNLKIFFFHYSFYGQTKRIICFVECV